MNEKSKKSHSKYRKSPNDFAKTVIEHYTQICETILATNKEEYEKAVDAHRFVLESFSKQLENENLTAEERANLSDKMIAEAEKLQNCICNSRNFTSG